MKPIHKYLLAGALITCILFASIYAYIRANTFADCVWSAPVFAWVDEDQNGLFDDNETPLEGVQFFVNDTANQYEDVGDEAVSDWNGKASVMVWLPGCPRARFEVYAVPPEGYQFVTAEKIKVQGTGYGSKDTLQFGFAALPGYATATPYASKLTCQQYPLEADGFSVGPDGTLWAVKYDGAARFDKASNTWIEYSSDTPLALFDQIQVGDNGVIWVGELFGPVARFQDSKWISFTGEDNLIAVSDPSIGSTSDGRIWFAPQLLSTSLASFNPQTKEWKLYSADLETTSVRIFTDGTIWRAAFGDSSKLDLPGNIPNEWTVYDEHHFASSEVISLAVEKDIESAKVAPDGTIWLVHSLGISRFNPVTNEWHSFDESTTNGNLSEMPNDLAFSADGSIWIASGSVHSLAIQFTPAGADQKSGTWQKYDARDGIPDFQTINSVAVDPDGAIWFGFDYDEVVARCVKSTP